MLMPICSTYSCYKQYAYCINSWGQVTKISRRLFKKDEVKTIYIIGGTASISDTIEKKLPSSIRIYGKDRFETNAEIIRKFPLDFDYKNAYITLGAGETGNGVCRCTNRFRPCS